LQRPDSTGSDVCACGQPGLPVQGRH